ncbi:MAG: MFS transporter [Deinococcales bacterium]
MTPQRTGPEEVRLVVAVALATMLAPLNSTMIAVALPPIAARFGAGASVPWLVTGYLIAMASLQPVAGKLGDRFGRRPLMLGGLALFALASLGAALAPGFGWLLAMRVLQGVAGAIAFPNGAAMLREAVPDARRGARFGLVGAGAGLAAAVGPPLAGVLVWSSGWQSRSQRPPCSHTTDRWGRGPAWGGRWPPAPRFSSPWWSGATPTPPCS